MSTQIVEVERIALSPAEMTVPAIDAAYDGELLDGERRFGAARGIVIAVLISIPFWALFGFAVYLLI